MSVGDIGVFTKRATEGHVFFQGIGPNRVASSPKCFVELVGLKGRLLVGLLSSVLARLLRSYFEGNSQVGCWGCIVYCRSIALQLAQEQQGKSESLQGEQKVTWSESGRGAREVSQGSIIHGLGLLGFGSSVVLRLGV